MRAATFFSSSAILRILLPLTILLTQGCSSSDQKEAAISGKWTASSISFSPITVWEHGQAERLYLGKQIHLDTKKSVVFGNTCVNPRYEFKRVSLDTYSYEGWARATKEELGFQLDSGDVVDLFCGHEALPTYTFIRVGDSLSLEIEGALVHLTKKHER
jgi:hypothetical protein